ncbi:MAG: efflux RND transporter periplasmic adaptor subunit, partial [Thermodesulfobacteriota bacterium]|nr:efflux RND transporter periplasmic adaptor subunit [Thermodesulfobacteriota bacterium]
MRKKIILVLILVLLAGGGLFWWISSGKQDAPKVLASEQVRRGPVREELDATGIVQSQVGGIVKIGAQATGRINRMLVKVGDTVEKGDLIAEIDASELLAQKAEAEAQLEAVRAESEYADSNLERQERLAQDDLIARDTLDKARQEKRVKEKQLKAKQAALKTILTRISYTRIISPITGVVSQVAAQEGETVVAGLQVANLITVLDPSRLEMWIYVDETDIGRVTPGLPVEFQVDAYPNETFHGAIN